MKGRILALLATAALLGSSEARAQDCSDHAVFHKGTVMTVAHFNAKGKELGTQTSVTESTAPIDGGIRAEIRSTSRIKGGSNDEVTLTMTCAGGDITVDLRSFLPSDQVKAYEGWEVSFEGDDLTFPAALAAGQKLPDGKMIMTLKMPGAEDAPPGLPTTTRFEVSITNRQVVAQESVTTRAGTFDAYKVTFDSQFEMKGAMPLAIRNTTSHVEWYVPGIGTVKSETWRKGKLEGRTELAELKRG